jgi:predicted secreted hydrolase
MKRRSFLLAPLALLGPARAAEPSYPRVAPAALRFPRDHGAHPAYRTEWWYLTGWLRGPQREFGFQITFFRNRPGIAEGIDSRFAAKQLLFAHAALSDPDAGKLLHDQRSARAGFGLAEAGEGDTSMRIDDWSLVRGAEGYVARIPARDFQYELRFRPAQEVLPQGDGGYSRKGPRPGQASHYYSWPQLRVSGSVTRGGKSAAVEGVAWLDHEWSSEALATEAAGWDWTGLNGDDGSALMAFRIRGKDGSVYWAGGSHRTAAGRVTVFRPQDVVFEPRELWRSPRTGAEYPESMRVRAGGLEVTLDPMMSDQEVDARASTGTVYWEGAVSAHSGGQRYGRGYLELTGYWKPLKL